MPTADLAPVGGQQTSENARTGEWVLQVQPIEAMHDRQLRLRHRPWPVPKAVVRVLRTQVYRKMQYDFIAAVDSSDILVR
jgi:hypothetical protein